MRNLLTGWIVALGLAACASAPVAPVAPMAAVAPAAPAAVLESTVPGALALAEGGRPAAILVDAGDHPGVLRAARDLRADLSAVAGQEAAFSSDASPRPLAVIAGTLGRSARVDRIVRERGIDTGGVLGRDEAYLLQVVEAPEAGIERALLIAGADRRGTIFGLYEMSRRIGVSPWNWWADVPAPQRPDLYVAPGRFVDAPAVRYRGIFINDEDPALGGWMRATYGGPNHRFYERVFQLILRHKGNYLWPAMWGRAFYDDDPLNADLADEMGIVIGTSHHEPMMRAHAEWERHGHGPWDYARNAEALQAFWREGIVRMGAREGVVTVGMRGDGDEPMTEGTAIALLERIVADQRAIVADVTGKPAAQTPQVWALYKEVQDYFDKGMRVPDDVTLLFADDNWGNIRRLPEPGARRPGGYGVYYHFDYVGGPRNYKWLNTVQIERTWEQMHLAWEHGVDRLWVVNVGDIKPMELPIGLFLDMAWNPDAFDPERLADYPRAWAAEQFGPEHAAAIGRILTAYTRYNARRKPELLSADTFSLEHFDEAARVLADWQALADEALRIGAALPARYRDAYYQLVEYPVLASANLNAMYVAQARNRRYAAQGRAAEADAQADEVARLFARDAELQRVYEQDIAGGKWIHMMSQTRIGYTGWQQPERNTMPETVRIAARADADAGTQAGSATPAAAPAPSSAVAGAHGFVESDGHLAIEAAHHARAVAPAGLEWKEIPNLGRTLSGVTSWPTTAPSGVADADGAWLEYPVVLAADGEVEVRVVLSPTLDFRGRGGLRFAVSIGDEAPQLVTMKLDPTPGHPDFRAWEKAVSDSVHVSATQHRAGAGAQVLKLWRIDPGVVFQRVEIYRGPVPASYLGPPESARR